MVQASPFKEIHDPKWKEPNKPYPHEKRPPITRPADKPTPKYKPPPPPKKEGGGISKKYPGEPPAPKPIIPHKPVTQHKKLGREPDPHPKKVPKKSPKKVNRRDLIAHH